MSCKAEPSKRLCTMPDRTKKRPKSAGLEKSLLDSDDDIYSGSDVDNIDYDFDESDISYESEENDTSPLQMERNNVVVSKQFPVPVSQPETNLLLPHSSCDEPSTTFWSTDFSSMREIPFTRRNELRVSVASNPRDYFDLFLNDNYLQKIVNRSNKYALILKKTSRQVQSRIAQWKPLTVEELKTFIGLLLHTGTTKMNRIVDYWKVHRLYKSVFSQYMSRNRFQLILRCLNFVDKQDDVDNRLNKCKLVVDNFNNVMESIYYPGKNLSLDESMVLWRRRLIFRQYVKEKRHKCGIKLYILAEPDGTILKMHVLASKLDETPGKSHPEKIVEKLLDGKLFAGHAVFMDNFYNSCGLAAKLLDQNTYCTGILNKKRKENPSAIITKALQKGENVSLCRSGVHVGKWNDKREISYITTEFLDEMQEVTTKRGDIVMKPRAIINYKKNMFGVDLQDQMRSYYPCERKILRWHVKIFVHTLMMSLINARILYNKYSNKNSISLYDFREKIIESYLPEIPSDPQPTMKRGEDREQHKLTKIENVKPRLLSSGKTVNATLRKDCRNCYKNKKRLNTTTECKNCPGSPPLCIDCFFELHDCIAKYDK